MSNTRVHVLRAENKHLI